VGQHTKKQEERRALSHLFHNVYSYYMPNDVLKLNGVLTF